MSEFNQEQQEELDYIIKEMREEGEGSRGVFYDNFGSAISPSLLLLAQLLEDSLDKNNALTVARKLYRGY